jgi:hypothetical protein
MKTHWVRLQSSFVFRSRLLLVLRRAWGWCGFNTKHQNTKAPKHLKDLKDLKGSVHCTAGSSRSFTAIRKDAGLCCGSRLRKGEVFAYVGQNQNLKDLKCMFSEHGN